VLNTLLVGELIPGLSSNLSATPSASRKQFKVEGLTEKQNAESLSRDLKTKPRWRVTRLKLSGGVSEGFVVFGDALVSFLKEGDAVAFSQPYSSIFQYGISEQADGVRDVFWVFQTPAKLLAKEESVRYVFTKISCEKCPEGVSFSDFWLEELVIENHFWFFFVSDFVFKGSCHFGERTPTIEAAESKPAWE
jgi:hypothetical protein